MVMKRFVLNSFFERWFLSSYLENAMRSTMKWKWWNNAMKNNQQRRNLQLRMGYDYEVRQHVYLLEKNSLDTSC